jgi:hypothetical protein
MTSPFRGSSSSTPRTRLRGPGYTRLSRDVYLLQEATVDVRARADAALLLFPEAVVCLQTAAVLLKLPVDDDGLIHLDRGKRAPRTERDGFKTHRLGIPDSRVHDLKGLKVADGPRCFADLSDRLDLEQLVALGDVVARRWSQADVDAAVTDHGRRPGIALLRQAVQLLDPRSDSPAETRARLRVHAAGFVGLVHGVVITDRAGQWLAAPDLADPAAKVAVQHEGKVHFLQDEKRRRHDVDRDDLSRAQGWEVVVSTATDDAKPQRLLERLEIAYLKQARVLGRQVLPPHLR